MDFSFNGGPDNCPARLQSESCRRPTPQPLQWRAGQLSGQTAHQIQRDLPACSRTQASGVGSKASKES